MYDKNDAKDVLSIVRIVESHKTRGRVNWSAAQRGLDAYFNESRSAEAWRNQYRLVTDESFKEDRNAAITRRDDKRVNRYELNDRLLKHLKRERGMQYLTEYIGVERVDILAAVQELQMKGHNIVAYSRDGEEYFRLERKIPNKQNNYDHKQESRSFKIALVSDTHLGSKYQQLQSLQHFYEYAHNEGVTEFYHAGDISDGYYPHRPGNVYEVFKHGFQQQLDYVSEVYPEIEGCTTYFITGNHDATHHYNGGANFGAMLELKRPDLVYLGHNFAKVWLSDKVDLNLVHPTDGTSYAVSTKAQQRIDKASGMQECKLMVVGHYHKMDMIHHKKTWAITMPSFFGQSSFMEGKNLESIIGGIIMEVKLDHNGDLLSFKPEFVLYEEIEDDF